MSVLPLRITYFQADKMHGVKGSNAAQQNQSAPYRITTYKGPELGLMGELPAVLYKLFELNTAQAANDELQSDISPSLLQKIKRHCIGR